MKQLEDFETVRLAQEKRDRMREGLAELRAEREKLGAQVRHRNIEEQAESLLSGETFTDTRELSQQLSELDQAVAVHQRAAELAARQLGTAIAQASVEICAEARPLFKAQLRKVLAALKHVCDANGELGRLREEFESQGIQTSSLPPCQFSRADKWEDPYGSSVQFYREQVKREYGVDS
jgi:hypothetical protein